MTTLLVMCTFDVFLMRFSMCFLMAFAFDDYMFNVLVCFWCVVELRCDVFFDVFLMTVLLMCFCVLVCLNVLFDVCFDVFWCVLTCFLMCALMCFGVS